MYTNSQETIETSINNEVTPKTKQAWETPTLDIISVDETESGTFPFGSCEDVCVHPAS